jgi:enhancing lycopene biosynthesis protein 2
MIAKGLMKGMISKSIRQFSTKRGSELKTAVVFSGCGVFDGSEITESVAMIVALSRNKCEVDYFAPNREQHHVLDHTTGDELDQTRNVMIESSRITRGDIKPLDELKASSYDAIFFPGGFGAAKNLSTFGMDGENMKVHDDVRKVTSCLLLGARRSCFK